MPQFQRHHAPWRVEGGTQVIDLETAVKNGILGGGVASGTVGTAEKLDLKKMIEELDSADDDVPPVFICPISLQPMVDPVTLCTGQTYERCNILRWFSMGSLTCPTTMQELWDDAVTPNRTLHQLIYAWFRQRYLLSKKRSEDVHGRITELLEGLRKAKGQAARVQSLRELRRLATAHTAAGKAVVDAVDAGGACSIASLLGPFTSHAVGSEAIAILVNLPLGSDSKRTLMQPAKISLVVDMLNEGSIETKINCTKYIEALMVEEDFRPEVVSSFSLLVGLLRLVKNRRDSNGTAAGLGLLRAICSSHRHVLSSVVSVGVVPQLVEQLPSLNPSCMESALQILELLSAIPEGCVALRDCPQTIPNAVRLLMRVSEACTQCALSILLAVCKNSPGECAPRAVEAGLAAKLLLVIQSGCAPTLKQQSAELLKLCSVNYTTGDFISKCKLTTTIQ
ncbi:unnamed protein product [Spirodela intermedia]|uniref:U-box domain-containing protein n=2 Tax=Spirodela intermedia TaxID=51605 RepID=A0A7I8III7_SPIIN|nr:unnamed protein product [Spirodela intermedia]CAA6657696.1 unnamed protein product [Spirodela intermedia]CAA7393801.1 unnamed protein product [Spirodela intermedia]